MISLSGRGRLASDLSLYLPIWLRILSLERCSSGRGDTVDRDKKRVAVMMSADYICAVCTV